MGDDKTSGRRRWIDLGQTLQDRLAETQRHPSGFDYLRLILSFVFVAYHAFFVCYGWSVSDWVFLGPARPVGYFLLPSFFALSGFLVAGSLERNTLPVFFTLRVLRIMPALAVEVLLSAFLLGTLLTTWNWSDYFSHPRFWSYLLNVVGYVHIQLPGVFLDNPLPDNVNGQLWTIPYELKSYLMAGFFGFLGLATRSKWVLGISIALISYLTLKQVFGAAPHAMQYGPPGRMLIISAMVGLWLYVARHRIPYSRMLFFASLAATWILLSTADLFYVAVFPLCYVTVYLGLQNPRRIWVVASGDYSYGLYLYSFPIQQAIVQLLPDHRTWIVNTALGLPITGICAFLSWHLVEKRVLAWRRVACDWAMAWSAPVDRAKRRFLEAAASRHGGKALQRPPRWPDRPAQ
ncbi:Peptidoglycan/LPS O-acetylase OafA/YrhL, contains acyltransferase and SGNH-hydrolase domains [Enhydrobacter aerosaccus]|uniref:Peptidoglycan/LPS O-acetylase OafA/YrhL, contains acyltransferase and SGNH-hydrolase domains n=1 Tax=Enhydrobacter aerosaccus TaxID=225324 RepID=A0A1T4KM62_9HYPH|nr:acyltransferase [Enhydrobacter aerosaccus]SJZ43496.1 Peptidoglycan/LPS O-acetylase OafA/YrhL, contains acyltransferase and SGNH-hydrolase domains [Enhydrobacter aerosaccus]